MHRINSAGLIWGFQFLTNEVLLAPAKLFFVVAKSEEILNQGGNTIHSVKMKAESSWLRVWCAAQKKSPISRSKESPSAICLYCVTSSFLFLPLSLFFLLATFSFWQNVFLFLIRHSWPNLLQPRWPQTEGLQEQKLQTIQSVNPKSANASEASEAICGKDSREKYASTTTSIASPSNILGIWEGDCVTLIMEMSDKKTTRHQVEIQKDSK